MKNLDLVAILDCETTGLDAAASPTEVGVIKYSLNHNTFMECYSCLIEAATEIPPEVQRIAGITTAMTRDGDRDRKLLERMGLGVDAVLAHNAPFDKVFADKLGLWSGIPWVDSMEIDWPEAHRRGCSLNALAPAYGVPVWGNHRALIDCLLLSYIFQREPRAAEPLTKELESKIWAMYRVPYDDKVGQAMVKKAGFRWESAGCPLSKVWSRKIHPDDVDALPFKPMIREIGTALSLSV